MGLSRLLLVSPKRFPAPEAFSMASGADAILNAARIVETLPEALDGAVVAVGFSARRREFAGRALSSRETAEELATELKTDKPPEIALVFGNETTGMTNEELAHCDIAATIPANPDYSSLNLAAAVQVACYELRAALGAGRVWSAPKFAPATHDEIEHLFEHAQTTLAASGFFNPQCPKRLMPRLRRLFARSGLEHDEVSILRGILAQMDKLMTNKK
jgi:tRNA/rRNA methyltransferase